MGREHGLITISDDGTVIAYRQVEPVTPIVLTGAGAGLPSWWTVDSTPDAEIVDFGGRVSITAEYPEAALTITNTGISADVFNGSSDNALYIMDAEGGLIVRGDLGAFLTLEGIGATVARADFFSGDSTSFVMQTNQGWNWSGPGDLGAFCGIFGFALVGFTTDPDVSGYDPSTLFLWFDDTPGSAKLKIAAKDSGGTVVAGEVALT